MTPTTPLIDRREFIAGATIAATPVYAGTLNAIPVEDRKLKKIVPVTPEWLERGASLRTQMTMSLYLDRQPEEPRAITPRPHFYQDVLVAVDCPGRHKSHVVRVRTAALDQKVTPADALQAFLPQLPKKLQRIGGEEDGALLALLAGYRNANTAPIEGYNTQTIPDGYWFILGGTSRYVVQTGPHSVALKDYNLASLEDQGHLLEHGNDGYVDTSINYTAPYVPPAIQSNPLLQPALERLLAVYPTVIPAIVFVYAPRSRYPKR